MAQLNITFNQEEILQLLSNDKSKAFAKLLQESLNGILKAESTSQLQQNLMSEQASVRAAEMDLEIDPM